MHRWVGLAAAAAIIALLSSKKLFYLVATGTLFCRSLGTEAPKGYRRRLVASTLIA
jgi:hypothetical protein